MLVKLTPDWGVKGSLELLSFVKKTLFRGFLPVGREGANQAIRHTTTLNFLLE